MGEDPYAEAVTAIHAGGVIAYPTEAVFGFGCHPLRQEAVFRILALKERGVFEGLLLIAADVEQLMPYIAPLTPEIEARVTPTWPGPQTWLVPASEDTPLWIKGRHPRVGVRVTDHATAAELCRRAGTALVSTSVNRHGEPPLRDAHAVVREFGDKLDAVVLGACGGLDRPTSIRDAITGEVVR